ncbi:hypothetical protein B0H14DRAFT_3164533 [Mycena olivaceomarginata]|nr:hypothetical protein B0H14DRAFT_3164533 [Mycena olivaceomarginata]
MAKVRTLIQFSPIASKSSQAEAVEDLLDLDKAPPRKDTKAAPATKGSKEADIDAPPTKDTKAAPGTRRRAKVGSANRNEDNLEASAQILIERDRSLIKLMKGKALDTQLELHRGRRDKAVPKKSDLRLVEDKREAVFAALPVA